MYITLTRRAIFDIFVRELATIAEAEYYYANITRQNFHLLVIIITKDYSQTNERLHFALEMIP